jgi:formylglycine-generating enzyme required for sulfatase activity
MSLRVLRIVVQMVASGLLSIAAASTASKINDHDGLRYIWIPPGVYAMGCSPGDRQCFDWESPSHAVTIDRGFWIGETEVTQKAYQRVTRTNPSRYRGLDLPVEQISWNNASAYCKAVGMRLPTESEWEYAARAGAPVARYGPLDSIAWYDGNSRDQTHKSRTKRPNAFGLYDMLGNVWEWVEDSYERSGKKMRVLRGGSFVNPSRDVRVSNRLWALPDTAHRDMGFRCAGL